MRHDILHHPGAGVLRVVLERPGEQILAERGAIVAHDSAVDVRTGLRGPLSGAPKRRAAGAEGPVQTALTATAPVQSVWIAPAPEGTIERAILRAGMELFLQSGAYLASTPGISLDARWRGARGFFGGGFVLLRAYGDGELWFASYGGLHTVDVGREHPGYVCDATHLVAFTEGLRYEVRKQSGLKGLFLSGEGLVCELTGHGRLWLQTRDPASLAAFLHPFRPVGGGDGA